MSKYSLTILIFVLILGGCGGTEPTDRTAETKWPGGKISVFNGKWYQDGEVVAGVHEVKLLLGSTDDTAKYQRACLENVLAKLASPAGDPNWNPKRATGTDDPWFDVCNTLALEGIVGPRFCAAREGFFESGERGNPDSTERLLAEVVEVVAVTRQRVYARVGPGFLQLLRDENSFGKGVLDEQEGRSGHIEPLEKLVEKNGGQSEQYRFRSWREKRRRGSLQCVLAIPVSGNGPYYADIDIDKWNPYADLIALIKHQFQRTNHPKFQCKDWFNLQMGVAGHLERLKSDFGGNYIAD